MIVVVDTNVLVSGLLTPWGIPGEINRMVLTGQLTPCHDGRILAEYYSVMRRAQLKIDPSEADVLLTQIIENGIPVAGETLKMRLPDPEDEPFLAVALAGKAEVLITGNLKHYPGAACKGVKVMVPARFIELYRRSMNM